MCRSVIIITLCWQVSFKKNCVGFASIKTSFAVQLKGQFTPAIFVNFYHDQTAISVQFVAIAGVSNVFGTSMQLVGFLEMFLQYCAAIMAI